MIILYSILSKVVAVVDLLFLALFMYYGVINVQTFLLLHTILLLSLFGINKWIVKDKRYMPFYIALFLPGIGMTILSMIDLFSKRGLSSSQIDDYEEYTKFIEYKVKIEDIDVHREINTVSAFDDLKYSNVERKKKLVVDLLTENIGEKVKILKKALGDDNTEVRHYAASILVTFEETYDNKLYKLKAIYMKNKTRETLLGLLDVYLEYIKSDLIEGELIGIYALEFLNLAAKFSTSKHLSRLTTAEEFKLSVDMIEVNILIERNNEAYDIASNLCDKFPNEPIVHIYLLKTLYLLKKFNQLAQLSIDLIHSGLNFTDEQMGQIKFWSLTE